MKYSRELLEPLVKEANTWSDLCRRVGIKPRTGSQSHLKKVVIKYEIDYSHFTGKASSKGKISSKRVDALTYCYKGSVINSHRLKERLIRDSYKKNECEQCNLKVWLNQPIVLELHHIDNDHSNNELSNLKVLCPNCHALETRNNRSKW